MSAQLAIASAVPPEFRSSLDAVVTLPKSFARVEVDSDVIAMRGANGWANVARDAILSGARGVLVVAPALDDTSALLKTSTEARVPVVLDSTWKYNPAVAASAEHFARMSVSGALVDVRVALPVGSDHAQAMLDELAVLCRAAAPASEVEYIRIDDHGFDAIGALSTRACARLSGIFTDSVPPRLRMRVIRPTTAIELHLPDPSTAAPGQVTVSGPDGETLLPTRYESAHRIALRRLHELVTDGEPSDDLADFMSATEAVRLASFRP